MLPFLVSEDFQVFFPFVKGCKDSCANYGYVIGALALSAAGVSKTVTADLDVK
jgi:hypothetical protein